MSTAKALFLVAASPTVVGVEVAGALALLPPPDELGTDVTALEDDDAAAAAPPALRDDSGARRATAACALALGHHLGCFGRDIGLSAGAP